MLLLHWRYARPLLSLIIFVFFFGCSTDGSVTVVATKKDESEAGGVGAIHPIDVTLLIDASAGQVLVRLRFENISDAPVLVKEGLHGFGVVGKRMIYPAGLWANEFVVRSESGQELIYTGGVFIGAPPTRNMFKEIQPGEIVDLRYHRLDEKGYRFLPGRHEYEIIHRHLEYDIKNDKIIAVDSRPTRFVFDNKLQ